MKKIGIILILMAFIQSEGFSNIIETSKNTSNVLLTDYNDTCMSKTNDFYTFDSYSKIQTRKKANNKAYKKGKMYISGGYGFGNVSVNYTEAHNQAKRSGTNINNSAWGVLHTRFDYGLLTRISVSAEMNFSSYNVSYDGNVYLNNTTTSTASNEYSGSTFNILARFDWHIINRKKVDFYLGTGVGYSLNSRTYTSSDIANHPDLTGESGLGSFGFAVNWGLRYYFKKNIAAYAELGLNTSMLNIGAVYVLN